MPSTTDSMGFSAHAIILGIGLLRFASSANSNCTQLQVYDGDSKISTFECTQFGLASCKRGISYFPGNLSVGMSVSAPQNFEAVFFRMNTTVHGTLYEATGVTYKWKVPADSISRKYTKGYYLNMQKIQSTDVFCRVWDLQNMDLTSTNIHFLFDVFPLNGPETFLVELFSLPPPSDAEYAGGLYDRIVITTQAPKNLVRQPVVFPSAWTTWITIKLLSREAKIEIKFGLQQEYFTEYLVQLLQVRHGRESKLLSEHILKPKASSLTGEHTFTNVSSGNYTVQLMPHDQHFFDNDLCQCYRKTALNQRDCDTCKTTTTKNFTFTRALNHQTSTTDLSVGRVTAAGASSALKAGLIAGVAVPSVLVLVLVFLGVRYFFLKRSRSGDIDTGKQPDCNRTMVVHVMNENLTMDLESETVIAGLKVPQVSRKSILLLASEDHKYFHQALQNFAHFLKLHCQCDVLFISGLTPDVHNTTNSYCWLSGKIDSVDFVIIVNSEAAYHLYHSYQNGWAYKEADLGPAGDLFTPGVKHICGKISAGLDVSNVMMVHFEHTDPKYCLPITALPTVIYNLPNRLKTFLFHLHDLNEYSMNLSKVNLPLHGNVEELEGGNKWLFAVHESKNFESRNRCWFEEKFGKPVYMGSQQKIPYFSWQVSTLSDESGFYDVGLSQRRLSSVSTHAQDNVDNGQANGTDNPVFVINKDDFFTPPECEVSSAYTVPNFDYREAGQPWEIDQGSTVSDQKNNVQTYHFHQHNEDCDSVSSLS